MVANARVSSSREGILLSFLVLFVRRVNSARHHTPLKVRLP
jgi:hypothetical protein